MTWIGSVLQGSFGQYAFGGSEAGCCGVWVLSCRSSFFFFFFFFFLLLFSFFSPLITQFLSLTASDPSFFSPL